MEFCPECGSMLLPTGDNELKCSCGYTKELSKEGYDIKEKIKEKIESKFLNRRIFKEYPKYKINIIKRLEEYRKEKIEKK